MRAPVRAPDPGREKKGTGMDEAADRAAWASHQAIEGEPRPPEPHVLASPDRAGRLLDGEFTEVGRAGRKWDRNSLLNTPPTCW